MIKIYSHSQISSNWKNWCFANLSVSLVKDDLIENRGNLTTQIEHKASQFSI